MVLIGTSILVFMMAKVYLTPSNTTSELQPNSADGTTPTTQYQRQRATIDKAADIANQQAEKSAETNLILESI